MRALCFGLPPLSSWYFSCRHTWEDTLSHEICAASPPSSCSVVAPGLLKVDSEALSSATPPEWDLTYALQVLPEAKEVGRPGASITELAMGAIEIAGLRPGDPQFQALRALPKGALAIHALVPDQVCGGHAIRALEHASMLDPTADVPTPRLSVPGHAAGKGEDASQMRDSR